MGSGVSPQPFRDNAVVLTGAKLLAPSLVDRIARRAIEQGR